MYLVEVKGRRKLLLSSVIGLFISSIFMAGSFFMMNKFSAVVIKLNGSNVDKWTNVSSRDFNICNSYRLVQHEQNIFYIYFAQRLTRDPQGLTTSDFFET